jgi:hypothetical protein
VGLGVGFAEAVGLGVGDAASRWRFSDWADVPKLTAKKTEAAAIRNSAFIRGVFNVIG